MVSGLSRVSGRLWWYLSLAVSYRPSDLNLFRTSTEILFMLRWYLIAVVGDVILTCHHQTWEVALPFSDHCILGNVTTLPQLNGCVSHCEPRWGKHRQYVMSKKSLPQSPTTQTAKTPVTYYHVLKENISAALKTQSNNPTDMLWWHYAIIKCLINIHEFLWGNRTNAWITP